MDLTAWRYKRFHVSFLLAWLTGGVLVGLVIGRYADIQMPVLLVTVALSLILGGFRSGRWWAIPCILLAGMVIGGLRSHSVQAEYDRYTPLFDQSMTIIGVLGTDPQRVNQGRQRLTLHSIKIGDVQYPGDIFATVYTSQDLKRGDTVRIKGTLREGFASYAASLSAGKILRVERDKDTIRDIRERFSKAIRQNVTEPMASLGLGFVVGQRSTLPDALDEQLKVVGLTHIVVASGYNLTILVRFVMRLFTKYSRYLAFSISIAMVLTFMVFSGLSPSMNRAVVVTILGLLAWYVGRRFHPVLLIVYVSSATALMNPMYVWADLGWYLSFFAFAGILIVAPLLIRVLYRRRDPSSFEQLVLETVSAEIMALPLVAYVFGTLPLFALVANVLVAPFIPAAMALTALAGVVGMAVGSVGMVFALPMTLLIAYVVAVVEWLAALPMAEYAISLELWLICAIYIVILIGCVYLKYKYSYDFYSRDERLEV